MRNIHNLNRDLLEFIETQDKKPFYEFEPFDFDFEHEILSENTNTTKDKEKIKFGDIVIVKQFEDSKSSINVDNSTHTIFVVTNSGENNINKRVYFGYSFSSNISLANKFNPKYPKRLYINDFNSIFDYGKHKDNPVYVDLSGVAMFNINDLVHGNWFVGESSNEFQDFIRTGMSKIRTGSKMGGFYWESGMVDNTPDEEENKVGV